MCKYFQRKIKLIYLSVKVGFSLQSVSLHFRIALTKQIAQSHVVHANINSIVMKVHSWQFARRKTEEKVSITKNFQRRVENDERLLSFFAYSVKTEGQVPLLTFSTNFSIKKFDGSLEKKKIFTFSVNR